MKKKNYCIDCGKEIYRGSKRCKSCAQKGKLNHNFGKGIKGKNNFNYIDGRTLKKHYCKTCGRKISVTSGLYGQGNCSKCSAKIQWKIKKHPMEGKHHSIKTREKISKTRIEKKLSKGKNNANYIHGFGNFPYPLEFNNYLKRKIRKRDNYQCQLCNKYGDDVHHIDYNKQNCDEDNLITLCHKCNMKANKDRDYWFAYFTYIMEEKSNDNISIHNKDTSRLSSRT